MTLRTVLALGLTSLASSQWLDDKTLGSCADVGCPSSESGCQIANQTYKAVGVSTFPSSLTRNSSNSNLTWTVAFHDYINYDPETELERTIEKAIFLGTPEGLNLTRISGVHGCAVILEAKSKVWDENDGWTSLSCDNLIGSECRSELLDQAKKFARERGSTPGGGGGRNATGDACAKLQGYLTSANRNGSEETKCKAPWTHVQVKPLTGLNAPKPFTEQQNSSTNCYPTEPKTNDLALVASWNNTGTMYSNDTRPMILSANAALTVFWGDDEDSFEPESHLSCLIPIDETEDSGDSEEPGAAVRIEGTLLALIATVTVAVWGLL